MARRYEFDPSKFWYIKLRDYGDRGERKKPAEQWGGYSIPFDENDNVYSFDETVELDHDNFAIVGYRHSEHQLVVIDVDCHDIHGFDSSELLRPDDGSPIVKSIHPDRDIPGFHFYTLLSDTDKSVQGAQSYIDIKANKKGHVVSPWHNDQYQIVKKCDIDVYPNVTELNRVFEYDGQTLLTSRTEYTGDFGNDWEVPDDPPRKPPGCLRKCLEARRDIPRDGSHDNPWKVDSAAGRRLVALGYTKDHAMRLLEKYPPQDGFDPKETAYQLDMLYQKQLHPESNKTLRRLGILGEEEFCGCWLCDEYRTDEVEQEILDLVLPDEFHTSLDVLS